MIPQRFRVMVVRYKGEMDFAIDNSINNGFEILTEALHLPRVGQSWEDMPFVRSQVQVLYDRTYNLSANPLIQNGVAVAIKVPIKKKLTYESTSSGAPGVGAGNVFLAITSDAAFNIMDYYSTCLYKQM